MAPIHQSHAWRRLTNCKMHMVTLKSKRKKKRNQNTTKICKFFFDSPTGHHWSHCFRARTHGNVQAEKATEDPPPVLRWLCKGGAVSLEEMPRGHSDADPPGRINSTTTHSAVCAQALPVKRYSWRHAHGIHSNFKTRMLCVVKFLVAASLCKDWVTYALPALVWFLLQNRSLLGCTSQCHGCPHSTLGKLKGWKLKVSSPKRSAI